MPFGDTTEDTCELQWRAPLKVTGQDSFWRLLRCGRHFNCPECRHHHSQTANIKDPGPNEFIDPATQGNEYWPTLRQQCTAKRRSPPPSSKTDPPIPAGKGAAFIIIGPTITTRTGIYSVLSDKPIRTSDFCNTNELLSPPTTPTALTTMSESTPQSLNGCLLGFIIHNCKH